MDLSAIEGLSDEQKTAIMQAHETDVTGLKTKNTQLMDEAKNAKLSASEKDSIAEEARKAAADAEAKALESQGKYEEAQKLREDERAKLVAEANSERDNAKAALDKYHLGTAKSGVLNKIVDGMEGFAEAMLDKCVSVSYDENGNAKPVFKHGENEFNSAADFINGVSDDAGWNRMLKGADSGGAGTKQSNNVGGASSSDYQNMTLEQKAQHLKNNPPQRVAG